MNSESQISEWIKNNKSRDTYSLFISNPICVKFIEEFDLTFDYIDDSREDLILQWTHNGYKYYLDITEASYVFGVFYESAAGKTDTQNQ